MHYYQFNIGDFSKDTAHLTLEEEAIYRRLIDLYYTSEKPITDDLKAVSRLIRARDKQEIIAQILQEFFNKTSQGYKHPRIEKELKKFREKSKKAADSAKARWGKASRKCDTNANAMRTHSEGNANHKPITNNHKPIKEELALPDGLCVESWDNWLSHRRKLKLKNYTTNQIAEKIAKLTIEQQTACINHSIENNYQGLFPERFTNETHQRHEPIDNSAAGRVRANIEKRRQARAIQQD